MLIEKIIDAIITTAVGKLIGWLYKQIINKFKNYHLCKKQESSFNITFIDARSYSIMSNWQYG